MRDHEWGRPFKTGHLPSWTCVRCGTTIYSKRRPFIGAGVTLVVIDEFGIGQRPFPPGDCDDFIVRRVMES